ncbi:MAG: CHASE2 domain-containing protein, partial [Lachnospiraceae bacterium]|nr:CHASE2 domain-containing protein [Lachnospiraceae bacterium]
MQKEEKSRGYLIHIIVIFAAVALSSVFLLTNAFRELESISEDSLYQRGEPVPGDIKIIAIDEETLTELGPYTDWSRAYFARLMERLDSAVKSPSVIGFDIIFSGEGNAEDDTAFADA